MMNAIKHLPIYAQGSNSLVARDVDGELWFWGAWDDRNKANEAALELGNGIVIENI